MFLRVFYKYLSVGSLGSFTVKVMGTGCVVLARDVRSDRTRFEWGFYVGNKSAKSHWLTSRRSNLILYL